MEPHSLSSASDISIIDYTLYSRITENIMIPQTTIHSILQKAEELVSSSNDITTAPVEGVVRMVKI